MADPTRQTIVLMGMRGSGETTIGRALADRLASSFVDLDELTLRRFPLATVSEVWHRYGERNWRQAEVDALKEAMKSPGGVLALGGGTPMIEDARAMLCAARDEGRLLIVHLHAPAVTLARRVGDGPSERPSLTGDDPASEVECVLAQRLPLYRRLAEVEIDTETESIGEALKLIVSAREHASRP